MVLSCAPIYLSHVRHTLGSYWNEATFPHIRDPNHRSTIVARFEETLMPKTQRYETFPSVPIGLVVKRRYLTRDRSTLTTRAAGARTSPYPL
jgi:hypothetical protein